MNDHLCVFKYYKQPVIIESKIHKPINKVFNFRECVKCGKTERQSLAPLFKNIKNREWKTVLKK
jgi:hypothetical protein